MEIEEAKKNLIRVYMKELKNVDEEQKKTLEKCNFYRKAWDKELTKYEKLEEERKIILTELNNLTK